jgi:hypothetical protein
VGGVNERKSILLRLDPAVHDALTRWAADELRSTTAQIEFLLRQALHLNGRLPGNLGGLPRRGRPPKPAPGTAGAAGRDEADSENSEVRAGEDEAERPGQSPGEGALQQGTDMRGRQELP